VGGQVRQEGNFSFARIYDAGHTIPSYQPETAFTVFTRIIQGTDISTGKEVDLSTFLTGGPPVSIHFNEVPEQEANTCWVRNIENTCSEEEQAHIHHGEGVIRNGIWYAEEHDYQPQSSVVHAGKPGSLPSVPPTGASSSTSTIPLIGVYTAPESPKPTSGASSLRSPFRVQRRQVPAPAQTVQVVQAARPDNRRPSDNAKKQSHRLRKGLIATAATLGSLLLL